MIYTDRKDYFIVRLTQTDMERFNSRNNSRLPTDNVSFGFSKCSGGLLRVIPNAIRKGHVEWYKLRDQALEFGQKELARG